MLQAIWASPEPPPSGQCPDLSSFFYVCSLRDAAHKNKKTDPPPPSYFGPTGSTMYSSHWYRTFDDKAAKFPNFWHILLKIWKQFFRYFFPKKKTLFINIIFLRGLQIITYWYFFGEKINFQIVGIFFTKTVWLKSLRGGGLAEGPSGSLPYFVFCQNTGIFLNKPSLCSKRPNYANSHT